jgi:hypothetical protein
MSKETVPRPQVHEFRLVASKLETGDEAAFDERLKPLAKAKPKPE